MYKSLHLPGICIAASSQVTCALGFLCGLGAMLVGSRCCNEITDIFLLTCVELPSVVLHSWVGPGLLHIEDEKPALNPWLVFIQPDHFHLPG